MEPPSSIALLEAILVMPKMDRRRLYEQARSPLEIFFSSPQTVLAH